MKSLKPDSLNPLCYYLQNMPDMSDYDDEPSYQVAVLAYVDYWMHQGCLSAKSEN